MGWINRAVARWADKGRNELRGYADEEVGKVRSISGPDSGEFTNPMNMTMYNAVGGRIVKFHSRDSRTERYSETTYIIGSDENFEESLGKLITLEAIKHTA